MKFLNLIIMCSVLFLLQHVYAESENCMVSMEVRPLVLDGLNVAYEKYDKARAEHMIMLENGDMILARYAKGCSLGYGAIYFSRHGFDDARSKKNKTLWLLKSFKRDAPVYEKLAKKIKVKSALFSQNRFRFSIPGAGPGEEHIFRLRPAFISNNTLPSVLTSMLIYEWQEPDMLN